MPIENEGAVDETINGAVKKKSGFFSMFGCCTTAGNTAHNALDLNKDGVLNREDVYAAIELGDQAIDDVREMIQKLIVSMQKFHKIFETEYPDIAIIFETSISKLTQAEQAGKVVGEVKEQIKAIEWPKDIDNRLTFVKNIAGVIRQLEKSATTIMLYLVELEKESKEAFMGSKVVKQVVDALAEAKKFVNTLLATLEAGEALNNIDDILDPKFAQHEKKDTPQLALQ